MAKTNAQKQRGIRQDSLREWLSKKCTAQHLVDNIKKIEELEPSEENFRNSLDKYKVANEQRIKLLGYYLPMLKGVEVTGDGGKTLTINLVDYSGKDD